jgi:hypothetical protein
MRVKEAASRSLMQILAEELPAKERWLAISARPKAGLLRQRRRCWSRPCPPLAKFRHKFAESLSSCFAWLGLWITAKTCLAKLETVRGLVQRRVCTVWPHGRLGASLKAPLPCDSSEPFLVCLARESAWLRCALSPLNVSRQRGRVSPSRRL